MQINKGLVARRFSKAAGTYARESTIQQQIAQKMNGLLRQSIPTASCRRIVEFGCGTGFYSRLLLHTLQPEQLWLNDICPNMKDYCMDILLQGAVFVPGDAERISFPDNTALITSCSTLQWFEAPEQFFKKCHEALDREGYLAFTTFGASNMRQVNLLTGTGLTYHSPSELEEWLRPMFRIIHSEEERLTLPFETPMQVLYHLKQTGVTGTGRHSWSRSDLHTFCRQYTEQFGTGNSVPLTYHPIYIIAQKRV